MDDYLWDLLSEIEEEKQRYESEQSLISKKKNRNGFSVDRDYINSKEYHDKFEKLPVNSNVQESLYKEAGRLLEYLDRVDEERLIAINARTGEFIVDNFARTGNSKSTGFTLEEYNKTQECPNMIILMHNHSRNGRPSAADLLSYLNNEKVKLSLIICHDGDIFVIYGVKEKFKSIYNDFLEESKKYTSNLEEAKILTLTKIYNINNEISDKDKIFDVRKL